jgi:hypothetical protein
MPPGTTRIDFAFHATADQDRHIEMALLPIPLATSATGKSTDRGLRRRPALSGDSSKPQE